MASPSEIKEYQSFLASGTSLKEGFRLLCISQEVPEYHYSIKQRILHIAKDQNNPKTNRDLLLYLSEEWRQDQIEKSIILMNPYKVSMLLFALFRKAFTIQTSTTQTSTIQTNKRTKLFPKDIQDLITSIVNGVNHFTLAGQKTYLGNGYEYDTDEVFCHAWSRESHVCNKRIKPYHKIIYNRWWLELIVCRICGVCGQYHKTTIFDPPLSALCKCPKPAKPVKDLLLDIVSSD